MKRECSDSNGRPPLRAVLLSLLMISIFAISVMPVSAYSDNWTDFVDEHTFTPENITYNGAADTFTINSPWGLAWVAKDINAGHNNTSKFILYGDIDLKGHDWKPIGGYIYSSGSSHIEHPFRGTFDGKGNTISNLYINNSSSKADYQGLFGYTVNANITNVNLNNVNITGNNHLGGLVGCYDLDENVHITISNCSVTGNVSGHCTVGGLVGWVSSNNNSDAAEITIEKCSAVVKVLITSDDSEGIGGLIGMVIRYDKFDGYKGGIIKIENCYAAGDVSGNGCYVGGLIGLNYVNVGIIKINNCYATGNVTCEVSSSYSRFGGLIGETFVEDVDAKIYVNNSAALNQYVNCSDTDSHVGRIVGGCDKKSPILKNNYAWKGMKYGDTLFTINTTENGWNGSHVSSIDIWCGKKFFEETLHWDFDDTWDMAITSIEDDNGISYPLPYLRSQSRDDTLRQKVIHLIPKYNVNFNGNGNTDGTMPVQIFIYNEPQSFTPNAYIKTGHTFEGWSNTLNGEKAYDDEYSLKITSTTTPEEITLYAVWKANITNVTLNNKSADTPTYAVSITYNTSSFNKTLTVPTYACRGFMGYNNLSSGGVQVINSELQLVPNALNYTNESGYWVNDTRNIELWAVWESDLSKLVNVTFDPNGGTGEKINQTVVKSLSTALMNPSFTKAGDTLLGWNNTSASGSEVNYPVNNGLINISKDTTLYAVWTNPVTPPPTTSPTTAPTSSSGSSGSSSGYSSDDDSDYSSDDTSDDDSSSGSSSSGSSANVPVIYTVYFDSCGGSHVDSQPDMRYGEKIRKPEDPTRDGYIFDGWYTADSYKWDFENDIVNKSFTLYANWTAIPEHNCCWFWIIILLITAAVTTAVIIKKKHDKANRINR